MQKIERFDWEKIKKESPESALEKILKNIELLKGDKGDAPTREYLLSLIIPLIPEPIPGDQGDPGEDYILTQKDKIEIASKIKVPVLEKVIEKTEVVKLQPITKEVALYETAEKLRDKLESLKNGEKLSIQAIEGLSEILKELQEIGKKGSIGLLKGGIHAGKGREIRFIDDETPLNSGDDITFTVKRTPINGSLKLYRGGARQRVTEDYTISGRTLTLINAVQSGEILLCDYRY